MKKRTVLLCVLALVVACSTGSPADQYFKSAKIQVQARIKSPALLGKIAATQADTLFVMVAADDMDTLHVSNKINGGNSVLTDTVLSIPAGRNRHMVLYKK
jgi:hypothetical protein